MTIRMEQITRHPERRHVFKTMQHEVVGEAIVPYVFLADFWLFDLQIRVETDSFAKAFIIKESEIIGTIIPSLMVTKKILTIPIGFEYFQYSLNGREYTVFESGLGANMHFYSIYSGNEVAGIIHKDDLIRNYCDTSTLYAIDKDAMIVLCVFGMFLESTAYVDRTAGLGNFDNHASVRTAQKELRDKYDPTFIPRIKAMDGIM